MPFKTVAPPRVALAAKDSTIDPALEAVAAALFFTVTPEGSVPTVQVQATCAMPKYPIHHQFRPVHFLCIDLIDFSRNHLDLGGLP